MEIIKKAIKDNKPTISESSLKTYSSTLNAFYYRHHPAKSPFNIAWFDKQQDIIDLLKDANINSRKTMYSAIIAMVPDNSLYKKAMMADIATKNTEAVEQTKSKTQEENWIDFPEIIKKVDLEIKKDKPLLISRSGELSPKEMEKLTLLMILCLTTGKFIPPRRNMDWNLMKWREYDEKTDNYVDIDIHEHKYDFVFNKYKTDKTYHEQRIPIPLALQPIMLDYIKHLSEGDYLLTKRNGSPFVQNDIGKVLSDFFGKKIGTSMLRHIYLTNLYKDIPALSSIQKTATEMGHSTNMALEYIKK
jgi:hypothetical protein